MKIFITGGTGFVGGSLTRAFAGRGHRVTVLDRTVKGGRDFPADVSFIETDSTVPGPWQDEAARHDVLINLAGASIFSRWNQKTKEAIYRSRILTTENLAEAVSRSPSAAAMRLFSTSAVGYYGFREDEDITEEAPPGVDFLASVAKDWEAAANGAARYGARVAVCRFGIVLGRRGGALQQMLPIYRAWLGAPLGSGGQWFSWVHEQDLVDIFLFLIDRQDAAGPFNCSAPLPVRNSEMTKAIGRALGVPTLPIGVPGFVLRIVLGEFGNVLLKGQKVLPKRLGELGYRFRFPAIDEALADLLKK